MELCLTAMLSNQRFQFRFIVLTCLATPHVIRSNNRMWHPQHNDSDNRVPTISTQAKKQSVTALRFIRWFCGLWWRDLLDRHKVRFYMKFDLKSNSFRAIRVSDRQFATLATRVQPRRKLTASRTINLPLPTGIICPADQTAPEQVTHHSKTKRSIGNSGPCNPRASPPRPNKSTAPDGNTKLPPSGHRTCLSPVCRPDK